MEGPFLNPDHLGAHDGALMLDPTAERLARLLQCPSRMLRLAPELPSAISAVRTLTEAAVLVSAGHSGAMYEQACAGEAGIRFGTHLYNAMTPLRHCEPGLAAALLTARSVTAGIIADALHVHPAALGGGAGPQGAGQPRSDDGPGVRRRHTSRVLRLSARKVVSDGLAVRLEDGNLAGSAATMPYLLRMMCVLFRVARCGREGDPHPAGCWALPAQDESCRRRPPTWSCSPPT